MSQTAPSNWVCNDRAMIRCSSRSKVEYKALTPAHKGGAEEGQPKEDVPCEKLNGVQRRWPLQSGEISLAPGRQRYEMNSAGKASHDPSENQGHDSKCLTIPARSVVDRCHHSNDERSQQQCRRLHHAKGWIHDRMVETGLGNAERHDYCLRYPHDEEADRRQVSDSVSRTHEQSRDCRILTVGFSRSRSASVASRLQHDVGRRPVLTYRRFFKI